MNNLPTELLHSVFSLLANDQKTISQVTLVCRQWNAIARPLLYRRPQIFSLQAFHKFLKIPKFSGLLVREIDLSLLPHRWSNITDPDIIALISLCPNLTFLDINYCAQLHDSTLKHIARTLGPHLTNLNVSQCPKFTDDGFMALATECSALTTLNFSYTDITDLALSQIATTCPTIRWLNLKCCELVTDLSLLELRKWCKDLRVEVIGCWGVVMEDIETEYDGSREMGKWGTIRDVG
ncbi:3365_t:CDS:2 [Ambispora leptoticha]|uniref:3365_t:CDS:1 n=1 Tax=Ambispora leptoticha TaxID=144679 RepID=A0A9N8ZHU8_9GLOM|nr:3365_t:CDS:2 [Ambispora leptoticha]